MGGVANTIGSSLGGVFGGLTGGLMEGAGLNGSFTGAAPDVQKQQFLEQILQSQNQFGGVQNQQQALAQALLAQSQGQGPNPAQLMLNQATQQNVKQGAGMAAAQKGISPALMARMSGQNTMMANQQAAGQGALMGAQQQLAAQNQLGSLYGQMGNQNLNQQQLLQQALANQNNMVTGQTNEANRNNLAMQQGNLAARRGMIGGLLGASGTGLSSFLKPGSGSAPAGGGNPGANFDTSTGGAGYAGVDPSVMMMAASDGAYVGGQAQVEGDSPVNDTVPAMLSPGEIVIPRSKANDPEAAKAFIEHLLKNKKNRKA